MQYRKVFILQYNIIKILKREFNIFMKKLFGKRLQELRKQRGLTQEKLSELIDIKPENYSRIESGLSFPKPQNIEKLADVLNVEIFELFKFKRQDNIEAERKRVAEKIASDDDTVKIIYAFLSNIGRL